MIKPRTEVFGGLNTRGKLDWRKKEQRKEKAKLHAALQEKNRLNLELINHHLQASKYDQVRSDYDQLRQTYAVVSQERDVAQQQRGQLQGKVENLEQVLKIDYKVLLLTHKCMNGHAPPYLQELITPQTSTRTLRSTSSLLLRVPTPSSAPWATGPFAQQRPAYGTVSLTT
ncbi:unnamed protein product [Pleuronectes platessa]|uniref:Uncharacterized protein n=1 Tax=Pleuronectes platessa TaxID=8262 RepID=A0A9N7VCV2_PLEPL|nr:unnamed protein product [Pleuronectes platessa]